MINPASPWSAAAGRAAATATRARRFGEVVAVCDVDKNQAAAAAKQFTSGEKVPAIYNDFRKLMERDDVHVIITGTPDHWHTMVNLLAVRTGKDVYSEKPLTLCIDEGKRLVKAVRENKRILQVGSQQRSDRNFRLACELVRNGRIGKLQHIIVGLPTGPREGPFQPIPIPENLNWDFYLGQAPQMDYIGQVEIKKGADGTETKNYRARCAHWDFRWWYCFSGGQMTDWGAHHNDIAQWGNGTERSGPVEIDGKSLSTMMPGGFTAAAKYRIDMKYANGVTMTIVDGSTGTDRNVVGSAKETPNGIQFLGSDGWIFVTRGAIKASKPELLETPLAEDRAIKLYQEQRPHGQFLRMRAQPQRSDLRRGNRPPLHLRGASGRDLHPHEPGAQVESRPGDLHRCECGGSQQMARPRTTQALRLQFHCLSRTHAVGQASRLSLTWAASGSPDRRLSAVSAHLLMKCGSEGGDRRGVCPTLLPP